MRGAKLQDYWNRAYRRDYGDNLVEIDPNGLNELEKIEVSNGILAICGLNGAGKSTIISIAKAIIGIPLSEQDRHRLQSHIVRGTATVNGVKNECSSETGENLLNKGWSLNNIKYIDCTASTRAQDYMIHQANLIELVEQYEEYSLDTDALAVISYLVGKQYSSCEIWELVDVEGADVTLPYFQVSVGDTIYNSTCMGNGEHFLLFLFWCINRSEKDTLLLIEEPETYISISSQIAFSNYLGKEMSEKGIKVILTTHSPYILSNIKNESIRIVSRVGNSTSIVTPDENVSPDNILGINEHHIGTFFVEDRVAADLLAVILEDKAPNLLKTYTIDIAIGGETAISERLRFPKSEKIKYDFVGVYDGDMRSRINGSTLQWKYCFLPGLDAPEDIFRNYLHTSTDNIRKLCNRFEKDTDKMIAILATIEGLDCHDWFDELRKNLAVEGRILVSAFYQLIFEDESVINTFIADLKACIA